MQWDAQTVGAMATAAAAIIALIFGVTGILQNLHASKRERNARILSLLERLNADYTEHAWLDPERTGRPLDVTESSKLIGDIDAISNELVAYGVKLDMDNSNYSARIAQLMKQYSS